MPTHTGSARYEGFGKDGQGHVSTQSGVLSDQPYGFATRFEDASGTNPEELIAAAHAGWSHVSRPRCCRRGNLFQTQ